MELILSGIKISYSANVTGISVPSSFRNLNDNYVGTQGTIIFTEIGGTGYASYTYSYFESDPDNNQYAIKVLNINSNGTPTTSTEYCIHHYLKQYDFKIKK